MKDAPGPQLVDASYVKLWNCDMMPLLTKWEWFNLMRMYRLAEAFEASGILVRAVAI